MIKVSGLDLVTRETLLYGVSFELKEGIVYGLSGRNGSGKTTLLRTVSGLRSEKNGCITMETDQRLNSSEAKQKLFYFESSEWFDEFLTGRDYLNIIKKSWKNEVHMNIDQLIAYWEMESYIDLPIKKYSLGMKQKVLLSMNAISGAKYLIMDEPTIGLDTYSLSIFEDFVIKLKNRNVCIFFSSHQNDSTYRICDIIYNIEDASLVEIKNLKGGN